MMMVILLGWKIFINGNWIETIPPKKNKVFFLKNILTDANRDNFIYDNLDDIEMHTKKKT